MNQRRKAALANNARKNQAKKRDHTGSIRRNAPVRNQNPLVDIFEKAISSIEGNGEFEQYKAHLQVLKAEYLGTPFNPTPQNCIELEKRMFAMEGETEEMKETIKEIRIGVHELVEKMVRGAGHCCSIEKMHALHNLQCVEDVECRIIPGENFRRLLDQNGEETNEICCFKRVGIWRIPHWKHYENKHKDAKFSERVERAEYKPSDVEEWLQCTECHTQHHATCTMYHPAKDGSNFICPRCDPSKIAIYCPEELKTTKSTEFLENELRQYKIICRLLYSAQEAGDYFQKNKETEFPILGKLPPVPYIKKTYGFFVKRDGVDILFFTLVTHEYKNVTSRKNNTIHLEYLDSVKYVEDQYRAIVHKSIFRAFCSYARNAGFKSIHFWACPPYKNEDYVLNAHPQSLRDATLEHLCGWYYEAAECNSVERVDNDQHERADDETIDDLLDAVCYEHNLIAAELEKLLKNNKALPDEEKMKKLKKQLEKYKKNMFKMHLKKAEQGEVQDYSEDLFPGSFALSDTFVETQRAHKLEFHNLQSARYATQMIIFFVIRERQIGEPIAANDALTPATIPQSAPTPTLVQVGNPMNSAPPQQQLANTSSSATAANPQKTLLPIAQLVAQLVASPAQVGNLNVFQMNYPLPQLTATSQPAIAPVSPAVAVVISSIRKRMLRDYYTYTFALINTSAPQPAVPTVGLHIPQHYYPYRFGLMNALALQSARPLNPHTAAAAVPQPIRLMLAKDYHRIVFALKNASLPQLPAITHEQPAIVRLTQGEAAALQPIRRQLLEDFYSYTVTLMLASAPQSAIQQTPYTAAAAVPQQLRLLLAQDYERLCGELVTAHASSPRTHMQPALVRTQMQQTLGPSFIALVNARFPPTPTSAPAAAAAAPPP